MNALMADIFYDTDSNFCIYVNTFDIYVIAAGVVTAKELIIKELIEYAHEYMNNYDLCHNAPNRRHHLPYVKYILACEDTNDVMNILEFHMVHLS